MDRQLFGDPAIFALEVLRNDAAGGRYGVWGQLCFWCNSTQLGELTEASYGAICGCSMALNRSLGFLPALCDDALLGRSDADIFAFLSSQLYEPHESSIAKENMERFSKFEFLTNWSEHFDGYRGFYFLVSESRLRLLVKRPNGELIVEEVETANFARCARAFCDWYESAERQR